MRRATIQAVRPDASRPIAGAPGLVLGGKYRLDAAIARGGMARVWRATHVTLNRPVAVKFVELASSSPEEHNERFLREAKVAASVRHRHVVDILDFGTAPSSNASSGGGEPYMVMELLEGETLDQRIARGVIPDREIVEIVSQILSGLEAVHRAGIVHRDLKPGNVFLSDEEGEGVFARLLDFGISTGAGEPTHDERVVVGTPEYMSPEQAFGEPLDARSDLYAIGVVLYEMLSGVLPFEDVDPQKVVEMVAHEKPPPLIEMRPDVPQLCAVAARAMAPLPKDRYASAREMRHALHAAADLSLDTVRPGVRDSRVSGMQPRAAETATQPAGAIERAAREARARGVARRPKAERAARRFALAAGGAGILAVGAAFAWLSMTLVRPAPSIPAGTWIPARLTVPAAPIAVAPSLPASGDESARLDANEPSDEPSTVPDEAPVSPRRARPRRAGRRVERAEPEHPSIRRELDF